jgi:hypothetical protein
MSFGTSTLQLPFAPKPPTPVRKLTGALPLPAQTSGKERGGEYA